MDFLWALWEITVNCIECGFLYYLLAKQLGAALKKPVYIGLVALILIMSLLNLCGVHYSITMVAVFILKVCYAFLFSSGFAKRLLWGFLGAFTAIAGNSLISVILVWATKIPMQDTLIPGEARFAITCLYCLLIIIIYWTLSRLKRKSGFELPAKYQFLMLGIMLLCLFSVTELIAFAITETHSSMSRFFITGTSIALLTISTAVIFMFEKIGTTMYARLQAEARLEQIYLEEKNTKRIEEIMKVWKHDFHNYLEVMQIYLDRQDYDELKKYMHQTERDFRHVLALTATGNSAVDAIISSKLLIANSKNIPLELNVHKLPSLPLPETKMCVLLGNLLDNALEACEKISYDKSPYINLNMFIKNGMLYISMENASDDEYRYESGRLASTKSATGHGYGLAHVFQIIKSIDGVYSVDTKYNVFCISIFLPYDTEKQNAN